MENWQISSLREFKLFLVKTLYFKTELNNSIKNVTFLHHKFDDTKLKDAKKIPLLNIDFSQSIEMISTLL